MHLDCHFFVPKSQSMIMSSFSNLNRCSSSQGLFCHVLLKRDQSEWNWTLRWNDTPIAIGCTLILNECWHLNMSMFGIFVWKECCVCTSLVLFWASCAFTCTACEPCDLNLWRIWATRPRACSRFTASLAVAGPFSWRDIFSSRMYVRMHIIHVNTHNQGCWATNSNNDTKATSFGNERCCMHIDINERCQWNERYHKWKMIS